MKIDYPLSRVVGIGPNIAKKLEYLNLFTVWDLINHYPFRYDDFSETKSVLEAKIGERVTLVGEIWSIKNIFTRSRKIMTQAIFNDGTSPITLTWFNQHWLAKQIQTGDKLQISGKVSKYKSKISIVSPIWEKSSSESNTDSIVSLQNDIHLHTGRLVPIYSETFGLNSKWLRAKISKILPEVEKEIIDPLPDEIKGEMLNLAEALKEVHFPENYQMLNQARARLGFDELFYIQLATQKSRADWQAKPLIEKFKIPKDKLEKFIKTLPFELTKAQIKVIGEILSDLEKTYPMNRLVQGEVGSGKTVVAAIISYLAYLNNLQTLYMAPTEILAFQHYSTFTKLLEPLGVKIGIYTGSKKFTKSSVIPAQAGIQKNGSPIKSGMTKEPNIIIGTHALLSDKLLTPNVGLVIVDEQQRFGVEQRSYLRSKAKVPHFLAMTATPIPRTVALTLYGDLDLSIIDQLPKDRLLVKTFVVADKKRADAYKFIEKQVNLGDQVFIITPLIEESETIKSAKAAKVEFEKLKDIFPNLKLGLLHGKLKSREKEEVMSKFKNAEIDILVSTSVVEVGVDITNATIMVIEGAERFGLSQLHQLRGRVGRGAKQSYCLIFPSIEEPQLISRLKNLEKIYDGLKLAELDLKIRGGGQIFGKMQSGRFELKIASFYDLTGLEKAKSAAKKILSHDPTLEKHPLLKVELEAMGSGIMPD